MAPSMSPDAMYLRWCVPWGDKQFQCHAQLPSPKLTQSNVWCVVRVMRCRHPSSSSHISTYRHASTLTACKHVLRPQAHPLCIWRPGHHQHPAAVPLALVQRQLRVQVPQPHCSVPRPSGELLAIRGEAHAEHRLRVTWHGRCAPCDGAHAEHGLRGVAHRGCAVGGGS